jgi:hypothetical protein
LNFRTAPWPSPGLPGITVELFHIFPEHRSLADRQ